MMRVKTCFAAVVVALLASSANGQELSLNIYHIDVGQGDATLVVGPGRKTMLIDAGNTGQGKRSVLPLLADLGITSLDYVVASHYDADHIGGLDEVITGVTRVRRAVYDRGDIRGQGTQAYEDYVGAAGGLRKTIDVGQTVDLGTGVEMTCVAVNGQVLNRSGGPDREPDENGHSVAFRLRMGRFDYFIGGDLTGGGRSGRRKTADIESVVAGIVGDVDALRISHHGSTTSSNATFLETLRPEVAIISVGTGGVNLRYRHPSRDVLNRLRELDGLETVFQTSRGNTPGGLQPRDRAFIRIENGSIVLSTDGQTYVVNGQTFRVDAN
jgi:beta-lactamase superfamily II metal-dependent hydrolase